MSFGQLSIFRSRVDINAKVAKHPNDCTVCTFPYIYEIASAEIRFQTFSNKFEAHHRTWFYLYMWYWDNVTSIFVENWLRRNFVSQWKARTAQGLFEGWILLRRVIFHFFSHKVSAICDTKNVIFPYFLRCLDIPIFISIDIGNKRRWRRVMGQDRRYF